MRDLKKYEGVIPAFYACYDDQGEISPERVRAGFGRIFPQKRSSGLVCQWLVGGVYLSKRCR
ncbi:putative N-acetylneuraminate lyase [Streptococcus anginosus]|nr:putative N-acetylneuraminate lyase [Streptococcus anginosus]